MSSNAPASSYEAGKQATMHREALIMKNYQIKVPVMPVRNPDLIIKAKIIVVKCSLKKSTQPRICELCFIWRPY